MHRFEFDEDTLKYFLGKIKERIDEKHSREYYLVEVPADTEDALIVGTHDIDAELIEEAGIENGKSVLIKERFLLEIEFTYEEKEAISYFLEGSSGGAESEIDDRLAGFNFSVMHPGEFGMEEIQGALDPNTFYIISENGDVENASHVAFIKDILTSDKLKEFVDTKVDKAEGWALSDIDFTEDYKEMLDSINTDNLIMNKDIQDNLTTVDINDALSANQGNVLRVDYLGDHQFEYTEEGEEIYGLTEKQVNMLAKAYNYTFMDPYQDCASLKEVADARLNQENKYHRNLKDRIDEIEARLKHAMMNVDLLEDVIDFYGFQFDFEDQVGQRIGKAKGLSHEDFDHIYPWAGMRRCNLKDGEILCYEGETGYKEDGTNGDVMIEIPKFYYKVVPVRTEPAASGEGLQLVEAKWMVSPVPSKGFKIHPAFIRNEEIKDYIYIGAYEACIFDTSANTYLKNDELVINPNEDKLASIIGAKPCSGRDMVSLSLINCRKLAQNKGDNYALVDFVTISAIQLLILIEHASFDSQNCVGRGVADLDAQINTDLNIALPTGSSEAVNYRGLENLWGNLWTLHDGIKFNTQECYAYWSNIKQAWIDNNNYNKIGFKLCGSEGGYIDRFGYDIDNDFVFLPTRATGSTTIAPHDYFYIEVGIWAVGRFGGPWCDGDHNGLWNWRLNFQDNMSDRTSGTRLIYT